MANRNDISRVSLVGFTGPELLTLAHHLQFAACRCHQELTTLRRTWPFGLSLRTKPGPPRRRWGQPALTFQHWAGLGRNYQYFASLAQAVERVVDGQATAIYLPDGVPPVMELPGWLSTESQPFLAFLGRERRRAQLAVTYIQAQPFDPLTKQDLLDALDIEIRFFSHLLKGVGEPVASGRRPAAESVPLLFVSLPQPLLAAPAQL
jgi:hypothetical protein